MNVKLVLLIVAMILVVPSISTAENNKEYTIEMDLIDGDIFVYDLDISGVLNSYLQVPEWDVNEVINNAPDNTLTIESFGNSCINIVNDCLRLIRSYEINMTLIHDEDSDTFTDDTTLIYSYREVVENGIKENLEQKLHEVIDHYGFWVERIKSYPYTADKMCSAYYALFQELTLHREHVLARRSTQKSFGTLDRWVREIRSLLH